MMSLVVKTLLGPEHRIDDPMKLRRRSKPRRTVSDREIAKALKKTDGNITDAAFILGVSYNTARVHAKRLGVFDPGKQRGAGNHSGVYRKRIAIDLDEVDRQLEQGRKMTDVARDLRTAPDIIYKRYRKAGRRWPNARRGRVTDDEVIKALADADGNVVDAAKVLGLTGPASVRNRAKRLGLFDPEKQRARGSGASEDGTWTGGRPRIDLDVDRIHGMRDLGWSWRAIAKQLGVSVPTVRDRFSSGRSR